MVSVINISELDGLANGDAPLYILVAGGIAIGKNHVVKQHIKSIPMMDVDHIMEEFGYTDYDSHEYKHAMEVISGRINALMTSLQSFIAMGTASNVKFTIDRLHGAKVGGYKTVLLHIDGEYTQALRQNEERKTKNLRYVLDKDLHRVRDTHEKSAMVVSLLKETALVDYFCYHYNDRKI